MLIHRAFLNDECTQKMSRKYSTDHNAPSSSLDLFSVVVRCLLSNVSRRIHQHPSVWWSIKRDSLEKATCRHSVDIQLQCCSANYSLHCRWTTVSISSSTRHLLWKPIHSNIRWTIIEKTLLKLIASWFTWAMFVCLFTRTHLRNCRSLLSSMACGVQYSPRRWCWILSFFYAWYTFTTTACEKFTKLVISEIFPPLGNKMV